MPLDGIASRYAIDRYMERCYKIIVERDRKCAEIEADYVSRGEQHSKANLFALASNEAEAARLFLEAHAETLLLAYEKAGMSLDESALQEISNDISDFARLQEHNALESSSSRIRIFAPNLSDILPQLAVDISLTLNSSLNNILRSLRIRCYENLLSEKKALRSHGALGKQCDIFISYASEDKDVFVQPLAEALEKSGLNVWYAPINLTVGDRLRKTIDQGVAKSRFGVVVLSHHYFAKPWPQEELEALFSKEVEGIKVILPIWHKLTAAEVRSYSPMLAGRVAAESSAGVDKVVCDLRRAMGL